MAIMDLFTSLQTIVNERFAKDVRQAIHDGVYRANQVADENKDLVDQVVIRQDAVEQYNNQMITEMTDKDVISAPEIIQARGGKATLGQRLDETAAHLEELQQHFRYNLAKYPRIVGESDDTGRFQRLMSDLEENVEQILYDGYTVGWYAMYIKSTMFIPDGYYTISDELFINTEELSIIAFGDVVIEQTDDTKNIFRLKGQTKIDMSRIRLVGGKNQVHVSNGNADNSLFNFYRCDFKHSKGRAIEMSSDWPKYDHMSAQVVFEDCNFIGVNGVINNIADYCTFRGGWVYVDKDSFSPNQAVFINRNRLILDGVLTVPTLGPGSSTLENVRWIDNYAKFTATNTRFGGEDGGIPTIYQFGGEGKDEMGSFVHLEKCQLYPKYNTQVIKLMGKVPYQITIKDCDYMHYAPYIRVKEGFDLTSYFSDIENKHAKYKIDIQNNQEREMLFGRYPTQLHPYILNETTRYNNLITKSGFSGWLNVTRTIDSYEVQATINGPYPIHDSGTIATLPEPMRPSQNISFPVISGDLNSGLGTINTNGEITVYYGQTGNDSAFFTVPIRVHR